MIIIGYFCRKGRTRDYEEMGTVISQLSWKIGGQQGEGVESTDRIFSTALNRLGYYLYGYRHFSSRI
jgi:2-oxoglutarate ferredoxin oxidoreductase subunit alpha